MFNWLMYRIQVQSDKKLDDIILGISISINTQQLY